MASERAYLDAFRQVDRYEQDGDRLVLRGEGVELVFAKPAPEPEVALVDTTWVLTALIEGAGPDGAVSSVVGEPTLGFRTDGTFHAATGTEVAATIDGASLTLVGEDGRGLVYRALAPG
jgi:heat shock protein HslJ